MISSYMESIMIDEDRFENIADVIVKNIGEDKTFLSKNPIVLGILNGGKTLADYISEELMLRKEYISTNTRNGKSGNRGIMGIGKQVNIQFPSYLYSDNSNVFLIVDDIIESGLTMQVAKNLFPNSKTASLIIKKIKSNNADIRKVIYPDYYGEVIDEVWVDFFWEH